MPIKPSSPSLAMISAGKRCSRSMAAACGRISRAASSRVVCWIIFCSGVSSRSIESSAAAPRRRMVVLLVLVVLVQKSPHARSRVLGCEERAERVGLQGQRLGGGVAGALAQEALGGGHCQRTSGADGARRSPGLVPQGGRLDDAIDQPEAQRLGGVDRPGRGKQPPRPRPAPPPPPPHRAPPAGGDPP